MSNYVYHKCLGSESSYVVGFFDSYGDWIGESEKFTKEEAAQRVHYLNGGNCNQDCNCNQKSAIKTAMV